eukprot:12730179-Alexandrium_andersonii.AAC.1
MSASLVGSEMCIRDSLRIGRSVHEGPLLPGAGRSGGSGTIPRSPMAKSCLLYTSDAADDM